MSSRGHIAALLAAFLLGMPGLFAQRAFSDSMDHVAARAGVQLRVAEKVRVAVTDITDPAGHLPPSLLTYVEEVLISRLVSVPGITVVERRRLDQVMEEQRRTASGTFDEHSAIELGRLLAADAIITGRIFQVDRRMHLLLRILDTGTGVLIGSAETFTAFPPGKEPGRNNSRQPVSNAPQPRPQRPQAELDEIPLLELRALGMGARYFGRSFNGVAVEASMRARERMGDAIVRGRASLGFQLNYFPSLLEMRGSPGDVGHITSLQGTQDMFQRPQVRFGNTVMDQGRLFLMAPGPALIDFDPVVSANDNGIEYLAFDRYTLDQVRMDMAGFNIPLRWYLGRTPRARAIPRVFAEFGFGMDVVLVRGSYQVVSTVVELDRSDHSYNVRQDKFDADKPSISSMGRDIWLTHFSFGGGLEIGRFQVFALGRFLGTTKFRDTGTQYDRLRGNAIAYPWLAGAWEDPRVNSELWRDGAVAYGATDLERNRVTDATLPGEEQRVQGNGVDRFWKRQQLVFGVNIRLY